MGPTSITQTIDYVANGVVSTCLFTVQLMLSNDELLRVENTMQAVLHQLTTSGFSCSS